MNGGPLGKTFNGMNISLSHKEETSNATQRDAIPKTEISVNVELISNTQFYRLRQYLLFLIEKFSKRQKEVYLLLHE